MDRRVFLAALPAAALTARATAGPAPDVVFDGRAPGAPVRALHGVNGGPLAAGGLVDLSARWTEAAFPLARLHDCHWPNPDVVDLHAVFPNPTADPARPASYDFDRTDEYVKAVHACGAGIVYRLGESIEHQKVKRHAQPPRDPGRWAAACVGVVRHYTEGWAGGPKVPVRYWEVWNEPDNRPNCWTGTDAEFLRLYAAAATALRKHAPGLKVGGPGFGNVGVLTGDRLDPTPFLAAFLDRCRTDALPLDFLSWHCYAADPGELVRRARGVRAVLDAAGFKRTESHLTEWNYLPGGSWAGLTAKDPEERERWHARLGGAEGAAFVAAALVALQDAPVDRACYFTAECPGTGLFSPHGVPSQAFAAFRAFRAVAGLGRLAGTPPPGVWALAGAGDGRVGVLLARPGAGGGPVRVAVRPAPWAGATGYEVLAAGAKGELARVGGGKVDGCEAAVDLPAASVRLVRLWADGAGK